ncbi:YbbR-like domain-containing protein [Bacillus sp. PS06]|uniref:CdaR family protein n=1 Tax=Bacillus sp. PS06 TaxID=2764176 RepID=UPI001781B011|nr:CdaR family protein [Bacillus sp. PS06]MBD8069803.1 YbbR-like domain-containing protein [Bacillus sp. PS06]
MDKFMNNYWFMRIVALLLALLLFMSVSFETQPKSFSPLGLATSNDHVEIMTDIPVAVNYNDDTHVVQGVPQTVTVNIEGPASVTKTAALQRDIEVFVDLTNYEIGTHKVELKYKNISDKINVKIEPAEVTVLIKEKVTVELPVEVEFLNQNKVTDGYIAEQPIVKPNVVKITGARDEIEQIALVKALIDLSDVDETVIEESRVAVYDKNQNTLPVTVEPSVVEVTVPITSPSKKVPFKIKREGELKSGLSIVSLESTPSEVTIYGPKEVIDGIEFIDGVVVELDKITEDTTLEIAIPVPKGVEKVSPETISIKVDVEEEESRKLTNLPIQSFGLGNGLEIEYLDPETATLDVDILGAAGILEAIRPVDIELYINVTNLGAGEHDVPIEVNGPQNVSWNLPQEKVKILISES